MGLHSGFMKQLEFTNGDRWDQLGLGTWKSRPGSVGKAVQSALELGYRHIDCAAIYLNESEIGEYIAKAVSQNLVTRQNLWVTSKLWNNAHRKKDVKPALEKTLHDLRLDYLDLYLIHWPVAIKNEVLNASDPEDYLSLNEVPLQETWQAMEDLKKEGLVKHIGVSNFSEKKLLEVISACTQKPEVNQVELHPYLQQESLLRFCQENKILMTAYSPLGSGDRSDAMKRADEPSLFADAVIRDIAAKHSATAAQILLAWHINRGTAVIPKSVDPVRQLENLRAADLILDAEDMAAIATLDRHYRFITGKFFEIPGNGYTNIYDE